MAKVTRICEWCEEPFERESGSRALYCSRRCYLDKRTSRRALARLRMTDSEREAVRLYNREKQRRYRAEKPELFRARAKRYRARHPQDPLRAKKWKLANVEQRRATKRAYEERMRQDPAWVEARRTYHREYSRRRRRPCQLPPEVCDSAGTPHRHCRKCGWPVPLKSGMWCAQCHAENAAGWNMAEEEPRQVKPETILRRAYHREYRKARLQKQSEEVVAA